MQMYKMLRKETGNWKSRAVQPMGPIIGWDQCDQSSSLTDDCQGNLIIRGLSGG